MMTAKIATFLLLITLLGLVTAQEQGYDGGYYDQDAYAQDNLYHDYAARLEEKGQGVVAA